MKHLTLIMLVAFSVIGCREIPGELTVTQAIDIEYKGDVEMRLSPAVYYSKVKINQNRRSTKVTLRVEDENGNKQKLKFKTRDRIDIPANGDFSISPVQSRLNVWIGGSVETTEEYMGRQRERQQCTYEEHYKVCRVVDTPYGPVERCWWETITRSGWKDVEYDLYKYSQYVNMELADESQVKFGDFTGSDTWQETRNVFEGRCDRF